MVTLKKLIKWNGGFTKGVTVGTIYSIDDDKFLDDTGVSRNAAYGIWETPSDDEGGAALDAALDDLMARSEKKAEEFQLEVPVELLQEATIVPKQSALDTQEGGDHYKLPIQPIQYIHANNLPFIEGNVVKYITRWREKNGHQDLLKVKHYVDLLIELEGLN